MVFAILLRTLPLHQCLFAFNDLRALLLLRILLLDIKLLDVVDQVILDFIFLFLLDLFERPLR